jgi:hypothetical protein
MGERLSLRALGRATLARQRLLERGPGEVPAAISALGGLQAQEPRPPFVALWSRLDGFAREDLATALERRAVVRATSLRGTLHLHTPADYRALRPVLQPMLTAAMAGALKGRMDGLDLAAVLPAAEELLGDGEPRTFDAIRDALAAAFPAADDRALGYAVRMHVPLVIVPSEDRWAFPRPPRFTLARDWLGRAVATAEGSPAELVRRHLAAFGPATAADVQTWSYVRGLAPVLEALRDELWVGTDHRGREIFDLPDAPRPGEDAPAPARLLPDFDALLLAHDDRDRVIARDDRGRVATRNLRTKATFLLDGRVAGTWSVKATSTRATLTLEPFGRLKRADARALEAESEALLGFLEPEARAREVAIADR